VYCILLGRIKCMKCRLLRSMIPGVCHVASCGFAVQTRLNGSRSCLGWRLLGPKEHCIRWESQFSLGFSVASADYFGCLFIVLPVTHSPHGLLSCWPVWNSWTYQQTALKPEYNFNNRCNTVIMAQYSV